MRNKSSCVSCAGASGLPRGSLNSRLVRTTLRWRRRKVASIWIIAAAIFLWMMFSAYASSSIYRVASASMEPTLHCAAAPDCKRLESDLVVVNRLIYHITGVRRGDIVAFTLPGTRATCRGDVLRIKRVIGLPGETVRVVGGSIYINNEHLREEYAPARTPSFRALEVPPNRYFLLGDNRRRSCDSRHFGVIARANLLGKVVLIYSPHGRFRLP